MRLEWTDGDLDELAELLVPRIAKRLPGSCETLTEILGWLTAREAAEYLGISVNSLHKKTAERSIPFEQDVPRGKLWFKTSDLDDWRRGVRT